MTRSTFSRLGVVLALAVSAAAMATTYALERSFAGTVFAVRRAAAWVDFGLAWLVTKMPQVERGCLGDWHRAHQVHQQQLPPTMWGALRRPLMSTRWRMCPST